MRPFHLLTSLVLVTACALSTTHTDDSSQGFLSDEYQKGIQARIEKNADECLRIFKNLIEIKKYVQDSLYVYSLYQSGLCYEMKDQTDKAIEVYQDALRTSNAKASMVVPAIFYELQVPSRLAMAYAKLDDTQTSKQYYEQAKKYLDKLQKNKNELQANRARYAEVLYETGLIASEYKLGTDFSSYEKSISYAREYLTLAIELNSDPYSKYAALQLLEHYQNTYNYIVQLTPDKTINDPIVAARQNQEAQKHLSETLLDSIDSFKEFVKTKRRFSSPEYKPLFIELDSIEKKLEAILQTRPLGEGLTPEAQKLQDPKKNSHFAPVRGEESK